MATSTTPPAAASAPRTMRWSATQLLRKAGADVNARTVLCIADADLKIITAANRTALHAAAARGWN